MHKKDMHRAAWMQQFAAIVEAMPGHAGRIDWNTATHFYFEGLAASDAARRYLAAFEGGTS